MNVSATAHVRLYNFVPLETYHLLPRLTFWLGLKIVLFVLWFVCGRNWYIGRKKLD